MKSDGAKTPIFCHLFMNMSENGIKKEKKYTMCVWQRVWKETSSSHKMNCQKNVSYHPDIADFHKGNHHPSIQPPPSSKHGHRHLDEEYMSSSQIAGGAALSCSVPFDYIPKVEKSQRSQEDGPDGCGSCREESRECPRKFVSRNIFLFEHGILI